MQSLFGVLDTGAGGDSGASICDAAATATAGNLRVAVCGRPYWRGAAEAEANSHFAVSVLEAYREQGTRFLQRLHGGFALAILDTDERKVLVAVDRMGIGRMAYALEGTRAVFSDSAEAVARQLGSGPQVRLQSIFSYLFFHMVPSPGTIFEGVYKLPPASLAVIENGRIEVSRYWAPTFNERSTAEYEELKEELHRTLRTAVLCSRPGGTSGAFLSGGLDSSTVAGILGEAAPSSARTFSIGFGYPEFDELPYARLAARRFRCDAHEYVVRATDISDAISMIARAYDEPFGNSSALPAYYCARLARQHGVDHLLAGDGGDELFAGNSRYAKQQRLERYQRLPSLLRKRMLEPALRRLPNTLSSGAIGRARAYVSRASVPLPIRLETWNVVHRLGSSDILHPDFVAAVDTAEPFRHVHAVWDEAPCHTILNHMLYYDWRLTLADNDLRKVETTSALQGVRVSYPMLHPDVVALANQVPPGMLMPGMQLRRFYKLAMSGFLPDEIIQKKKHGFGLPFGLWLRDSSHLRNQVIDSLSSFRSRGIVRDEFIDELLKLHDEHDASYYGALVWVLVMLEQWFQEHCIRP